ncbi:MAG TPA: hypothetical protein ENN43_00320 [bacterium]|nr:hypothetical protein [bacterium]
MKRRSRKPGTTIEVREEFSPYGTKTLDSKDRISLGGKLKSLLKQGADADGFMVYVGKNGDILLRPGVTVPSSEAWVYKNRAVMGSIRKGLEEASEGKTRRVKKLGPFLDEL